MGIIAIFHLLPIVSSHSQFVRSQFFTRVLLVKETLFLETSPVQFLPAGTIKTIAKSFLIFFEDTKRQLVPFGLPVTDHLFTLTRATLDRAKKINFILTPKLKGEKVLP